MIAVYLVAIYLGQVGYCILLVFARRRETKVSTLIQKFGECVAELLTKEYACSRRRVTSCLR